jgi:small subunit ribosomal protein S6
MNDYEITYILRPNLEDADVDARATAIGEIIKGQSGEVVAIEKLGKKRLAYEINDLREGHYVVMQFRSSGDASKELERQLKLHEDVVRALVIHLDKQALAQMKIAATQAAMAPATPQAPYERDRDRDRAPQAAYDRG